MALGKENFKKIKNLCRGPSLALGKGDLCRGPGQWPSAKKIKKKIFAECLTAGTRKRLTPGDAVTHPAIFAEGQFAEG